ncbi:hypothetical protein CUR178_08181 [Leishmania enriettii]|uniref:C2H2-type domain-containing protein n=1 Tax=Leishmania enriettii TaxID=5663 RepID=A0A836H7D5_LEIEN|nr:hypothetical protein CUR178_08181 [Leishmania enriettii]
MLPTRWPSRPSLPARAGWRHLVHPVRSAFAHSAVLRQAGTLSTLLPGTASAGIGNIRESNSDDRSGSAPDPPSGGNGAGTTQSSPPPSSSHRTHPEVCFYEAFIFSSVDLHLILLEEAHRKHGVWLNVPPQLAPSIPNVGPPAVPEPIYPAAQQRRLAAMSAATMDFMSPSKRPRCASGGGAAGETDLIKDPSCFAYRPTHDPPPFSTTGTRSLWVPAQRTAAGGAVAVNDGVPVVSMPTPAPSSKTASCYEVSLAGSSTTHMSQTEVQSVAIRSPVDASMLYHCSECGRAFRRHHVAEQHVQQRHMPHGNGRNSSSVVVVEGPGPGEIIGYEERAVSVAAAATTEPSAAASEAHTSSRKAAIGDRSEGVSGEVSATKGTTNASSPPKPPSFDRTAAFRSTPRVELPESALIDNLLDDVWDEVALARGDIEKPSGLPTTRAELRQHPKRHYDSFHGRFFIPSVLVFEGTADNRADQGAAGERAAARATPEGAAPGIKRRLSSASLVSSLSMPITRMLPTQRRNPDGTLGAVGAAAAATGGGIGGGALGAAPTAQDLSIAELSRHYPNPFGDSPNAALVESEKEPINPFVDVEGQAAAVAMARKAACDNAAQPGEATNDTAEKAGSTPVAKEMEWLSRWAARPYACPLCQRRALPDLMRIMAPLLPSSFAAVSEATTSETSTARADDGGRSATSCPESGTKRTAVAAVPVTSAATPAASSPRPARGAPPPGFLEDRPLVVDVEAWRWYADRVPRFRLLDSLEDHLQSRHAGCYYGDDEAAAARDGEDDGAGRDEVEGLSDADWRRLYQVSRHKQLLARAELLAVREAYRILFPMQESTSAVAPSSTTSSGVGSSTDVDSDARKGGAERTAIGDCVGSSRAPPAGESPASRPSNDATAADSTEAPQVHVRSAVNMVLVGTVRDVQEGFLGATRILQYVLAVRNTLAEAPSSASVDAGGSDAAASEEEQEDADANEELIVVRCVGDLVPVTLLAQQVRLGSTMFVAGSLRMNRNIDTVSRRSHAYPYVQVVPPLGCVRVLGA